MSISRIGCLKRTGCVLLASLSVFCMAAWAEPDVLERPPLIRTPERVATSAIMAVAAAGSRLVAVGERGLVLCSEDEGKTWRQSPVPVSVTLTSVAFADAGTVWAVGHSGVVLRSDDGGATWSKVLDGNQVAALALAAAQAPGADPLLAADAERLVADGPDKPFLAVHFFDPGHGLVVGAYGLALSTSDGGRTWVPRQQGIDNPRGLHLYAILATEKAVWLAGEQGALFVSTDGGASYQAVQTPYQGSYFGMLAAGPDLLVFGMRGNAYWSGDQGATWQKSQIPGDKTLTAGLHNGKGELLLADDAGNVFVSRDGGKRFEPAPLPRQTPLNAIVEVAGGRLLLAGVRGISHADFSTPATDKHP